MRIKSFLVLILFTSLILSCKKKKSDPPPASSTTTTTSNLSFYGILYSNEVVSVYGNTLYPASGSSSAIFPTQGFIETGQYAGSFIGTAVNAGTVSLNSVTLKADNQSGNTIYNDTTSVIFNSPFVWSVTGGNDIPAFTYTFVATRPSYTGWTSIPDTIKIANGCSFNVTGLSAADEISVTITGGGYLGKIFPGNSATINFSAAELSSLTSSSFAYMMVTFSKTTIANGGGKNFKFKTGYQVFKQIVIQ